MTASRKLTGRSLHRLLVRRFLQVPRARWWRGSLFFSSLLHLLLLTVVLTALQRERRERLPEIAWEIATLSSPDEIDFVESFQPPPTEEPRDEPEPDAPEFASEARSEPNPEERPTDTDEHAIVDERLRLPEASMPPPPRLEMLSVAAEAPGLEPLPSPPRPAPAVVTAAKPSAGSTPAPRYPRLARRMGWEGFVTLAVEVDVQGDVLAVTVASSSGHDQLDQAALEAVRRWRFEPGRRDGRATRSRTEVTIEFRLR